MGRKVLFNGFFMAFLAFMLYLAGLLLLPSAGALLAAAVLAVVFHPVHLRLGRYIPQRSWRALVSDLFVFIFVFIPLGLLIWAAIAQSDRILSVARPAILQFLDWAPTAPAKIMSHLEFRFPWLAEQLSSPSAALQEHFTAFANRFVSNVARFGAEAAKLTAVLLGYLFLVVTALFFFFRDGEELLKSARDLIPLQQGLKLRLEERVRTLVVGVVRGLILTSLAQGVVATIGFLLLRAPSAFLLGLMTMLASIIPVIGSALIWAPLCLYYFWTAAYGKGIFLLIWGLVVTGSIDNILRPWLVGADQDVPFFWLFFSIVGGLQIFGLWGLLVGPLVMAILMLLLEMYQQVYLQEGEAAAEAKPARGKTPRRA